jgi:hypothetical protein
MSQAQIDRRHKGERYLVAMLGQRANWVRSLRADGHAVLRHGQEYNGFEYAGLPVKYRIFVIILCSNIFR